MQKRGGGILDITLEDKTDLLPIIIIACDI
jgi:hypothetical protein